VGVEVGAQRLDHHPLAGGDGPQQGQLVLVQGAGVGVGEEAGLVEHQPAHLGQVVDRRVVAPGGQPVGRVRVTLLGALTEREQGLVTAGLGARPGDGQHVLGREVRLLQPGGRLGERAVAAAIATQHRERDEHLG
jgi:hypothetical protein